MYLNSFLEEETLFGCEMEWLLLIMNCQRYRYKAVQQQETWLRYLPSDLPYYHVLGNPTLTVPYHFDEENRILWIRVLDDYVSLPQKVIRAYAAVYQQFPTLRYVCKTDDDQTMDPSRVREWFDMVREKMQPPFQYGGHVVHVKQPYLSQYYRLHPELPTYLPVMQTQYCSGRFYVLSREALQQVLIKQTEIEREYLEDYAIGYHLPLSYKQSLLNLPTDSYFKDAM